MNPVHPYLNPQENPANALGRLLQLLPSRSTIYCFNEIQLCEAICYQARRTHHIVCSAQTLLQTLLPAPNSPGEPCNANLFSVNVLLQSEADITHTMGELYAVIVENFFQRNPHLPRYPNLMPQPLAPGHVMANMPGPWPFARAHTQGAPAHPHEAHAPAYTSAPDTAQLLAEYDKHYYFPLGRLLQQLPGDITNQPRLTPEQGQMCAAVSGFAVQAITTIKSGLAALETLLGKTIDRASHNLPEIDRLFAYLQAETDFMQTCHEDYRDAAESILRAA
jgi:hypothetical protein